MKVLKQHEFKRASVGGRKHNWDEILDGQIRQLDKEDMGDAKPSTFGGQARTQAKKRGLAVHLQTVRNGDGKDAEETGLIIQAYKPEPGSVEAETGGDEAPTPEPTPEPAKPAPKAGKKK